MSIENNLQNTRKEIKQYLKDLETGDFHTRATAAYMLGVLGKKDKSIKRSLTKALNDKNWEVRKWSALSLGEIGERESQLLPILIEILRRDDSKEFKSHAAVILGELEQRAIPALPELYKATLDENTRVREWANWAVFKIAGKRPSYRSPPVERPKLSDRIRFLQESSD